MDEITSLSQLPTIGKVVVAVVNGTRAPCRKFLGELNQAIGIVENPNNPSGGSYYHIQLSTEVNEVFHISQFPCAIIMVNGVEKKRFSGHWTYHFEMAGLIQEGFSL